MTGRTPGIVHVYDVEPYGSDPVVTVCGVAMEEGEAATSLVGALLEAPPGTCGTVRTARITGLCDGRYDYLWQTGRARHDEATGTVVWIQRLV